jgi:predicted enzyme related to lactoylglutathione lyase
MSILVNIDVPDLRRAVAFYTEGLGLHVGRRFDDGFLELLGAGSPIYLLVNPVGSAPIPGAHEPTRIYSRHWTPVHLDFVVDDIVAARDRAIAAGAVTEGDISEHAYGRLALMADPFGNGFCLLQFTGRGYDAITTG